MSSNVIDYITMRKLDRFKRNRTEGLQDYVTMPVYEDRKRYNIILKVRQSWNDFFKPTFPQKKWTNEFNFTTLIPQVDMFFGGNLRHQKDISKLTHL